jgi:hypothetical protein
VIQTSCDQCFDAALPARMAAKSQPNFSVVFPSSAPFYRIFAGVAYRSAL